MHLVKCMVKKCNYTACIRALLPLHNNHKAQTWILCNVFMQFHTTYHLLGNTLVYGGSLVVYERDNIHSCLEELIKQCILHAHIYDVIVKCDIWIPVISVSVSSCRQVASHQIFGSQLGKRNLAEGHQGPLIRVTLVRCRALRHLQEHLLQTLIVHF